MSRNGHIDLEFAGRIRRFRLAIGELEELQEATGVGPVVLLQRFFADEHSFVDVREVLRIGLMGGGEEAPEAYDLVRDLHERPVVPAIAAATVVLTAALERDQQEPIEPEAPKDAAPKKELPNGQMAFSEFYKGASIIGLTVADVRQMSLWQFSAFVKGHNEAHDPKAGKTLSEDEAEALWREISV
ncbi:gene transfer agent family protein [Microvirga sp. TS319]|uniref:gene transfer agent family protein n=1 Tax=Microvirga sp. TS319 TaxID=3241165 RepID=UPI00351A1377